MKIVCRIVGLKTHTLTLDVSVLELHILKTMTIKSVIWTVNQGLQYILQQMNCFISART